MMKNGLSPKKNSTRLCQKVAKLLPVPLPKTMSKISALLLSIILLSLRNNSGTNSQFENSSNQFSTSNVLREINYFGLCSVQNLAILKNLSFDFWQIYANVAKMYFLRFQSNKLNYSNVQE